MRTKPTNNTLPVVSTAVAACRFLPWVPSLQALLLKLLVVTVFITAIESKQGHFLCVRSHEWHWHQRGNFLDSHFRLFRSESPGKELNNLCFHKPIIRWPTVTDTYIGKSLWKTSGHWGNSDWPGFWFFFLNKWSSQKVKHCKSVHSQGSFCRSEPHSYKCTLFFFLVCFLPDPEQDKVLRKQSHRACVPDLHVSVDIRPLFTNNFKGEDRRLF